MHFLHKRQWYLASIVLGLAAIAAEISEKGYTVIGVSTGAKATAAKGENAPPQAIEALKKESQEAFRWGAFVSMVGVCLAASAFLCWIGSRWREETGWESIPIIILTGYLMCSLLMV